MTTTTAVRERPIIFTAESVKAILDGRKSMTRRVVKPQPEKWIDKYEQALSRNYWIPSGVYINDPSGILRGKPCQVRMNAQPVYCPYIPGDHLWVREAFSPCVCDACRKAWPRQPDPASIKNAPHGVSYRNGSRGVDTIFRSPLFMPRWASRITLEITKVRVERVNEISEADAIAEGVNISESVTGPMFGTARGAFCRLWDAINGKKPGCAWKDSPWVWVIQFRRID